MNFRRLKYEQIMNSTKIYWKTAEIRIFWQIPAEMSLESQCLCGFPEGTVEMKLARLGHWHFFPSLRSLVYIAKVEMKLARLGHWHLYSTKSSSNSSIAVEMKLARLGHWHSLRFFL